MFWLWIFCTQSVAYFSIQYSRGAKVLKEVLGETFEGAIASDFYSAYVSYSKGIQQFRLAHLIRDVKFFTTLPDAATKMFGTKLLAYFRRLFRIWNAKYQIPPEEFNKKCERLQREMFKFLHSEEAPLGGTKVA
jgi:transposase